MKKQPIRHQLDGLIALLLFGVFSVCILAVLLTGADAYRRLTDRDRAAFDRRTTLQYLATRVRQADRESGVYVTDFNGVNALVFSDGDGYVTRVYCHNGSIMELYAEEGLDLSLEAGEPIMAAEELDFSMEDGRLRVSCEGDSMTLSLRSGKGALGCARARPPW